MKNSTLRELMLQISEIDETRNPFGIALQMMYALKNDEITSKQYDLLAGSLEIECARYGIPTSHKLNNEVCSLF